LRISNIRATRAHEAESGGFAVARSRLGRKTVHPRHVDRQKL